LGHIFPNDVIYRSNAQKAPSCAETRRFSIKRENRSNGSTWACAPKMKRTGQSKSKKSHKDVIFHLLGEKLYWDDLYRNLHSSCRPRHNHVRKIFNCNFQGLRFCMMSNFRLSYS